MSMQVTLTLSDELYEQAKRWATITQQDLTETLTNVLTIVLTPVHTTPKLKRAAQMMRKISGVVDGLGT